ncbi:MAG: hypothetical protein LBI72_14150 [Flavobacteriaceae bacterium]|nr:hypothetical protein [Flavobacteriaceae bacterium]
MKKLFMLLFVACLATFGISCSPEKIESGKDKWDQIELTADKIEIEEGEVVTFETKVNGEILKDAILYREGVRTSNPMLFSTEGTYTILAKKNRLQDSEPIVIKVIEKPTTIGKRLVLTADKEEIVEGETVTFTVKADEKEVKGAEIFVDLVKVTNPHKFDKKGMYRVTTKAEGYIDSDGLMIVVKEKPTEDPVVKK